MVLAIGRNEEQQDGVAFDMPQESVTQSLALCRAFDDAWQIGHTEGLTIAIVHHT